MQGASSNPYSAATAFRLSARSTDPSNYLFGGALDEVRIYNGALTNAEVASLYDSYSIPEPGAGALALGFVAAWFARRRRPPALRA